jgi:nucleoside-diphosphate-sugar epimerase
LSRRIFVARGAGYAGSRLVPILVARGHEAVALVRPGSEHKLPAECTPILGDALDTRAVDRAASGGKAPGVGVMDVPAIRAAG